MKTKSTKSKTSLNPRRARSGTHPPSTQLRALAQHMEGQLQIIQRLMRQRLQADYARGHLTGPQRLVMSALVRSKGLSLKQLSAAVSLAHSTASGIVDRLEKQGLVERQALLADGRVTLLVASRPVREFLDEVMPELVLHPLIEALRRASTPERNTIAAGLDTLARLLSVRETTES